MILLELLELIIKMSKRTKTADLSDETREKIAEELEIKIEASKYANGAPPKFIYPFSIVETDGVEYIHVPFAYGKNINLKRPLQSTYPEVEFKFEGTLRPEQKIVRSEAIGHLNKYGCTLLACFPGFGKCLKLDTPVIMYDGTTKMVQDVVTGDVLMGDDSTARNVLSTCVGHEQMYDIVPTKGDSFGCNESHILSLKFTENGEIMDISVKEYLTIPKCVRVLLKLYSVGIDFPEKKLYEDPYLLGLRLCNNVDYIPHVYKCNSRYNRLSLLAGLIDSSSRLFKNWYELIYQNETLTKDILYLARSLGFKAFLLKRRELDRKVYHITIYGNGLEDIPTRTKPYPGKPDAESQLSGFDVVPIDETDYYGFCLDGNHRFLLGDFTVTHNTCCAINLATKLKLPVLIITHRIVLIRQWKDALNQFTPTSEVQVLTAKSKIAECDFYIMNASNVPKMSREFFKDIGLLIVDEAHIIMAERMSECMQMICPRYVIGLTATPNRPDGLDVLLDLYFGTKRIFRKLSRPHTVYKIETSFKPETTKNKMGMLDWGSVLESQCGCEARNEMIIRLVMKFEDLVILILCKRVDQANYIFTRLEEEKVDVTSLIGKQQTFEKTSRVLVGTSGKAGVGFDHKRLNCLILASDIEGYFIQYLGRCMRTEEVVPVIFDIVDDQYTLKRHFATRQKVYFEHGGTVRKFAKEFPKFEVI
jgi:hypothetical protein